MSTSWSDLLGQAVSGLAQSKGANISSDQISSIAAQLAQFCAQLVDDAVKKQAQADADKAASGITTLADAEAFERKK